MKTRWIMVVAVIGCAGSVLATPVQVSITGTANYTAMGYTSGQSYTFNWVINDGYTGGSADDSALDHNYWAVELASDPFLWSSVSGDGLVGTYSRPSGVSWAPYDDLESSPTYIYLLASSDTHTSLGLTANGAAVNQVQAAASIGVGFAFSGTYINPAEYFATYEGVYTSSAIFDNSLNYVEVRDTASNTAQFTPTSVTIAAIPEPATALLFGLGGMGAWLVRRNKVKSKEEMDD